MLLHQVKKGLDYCSQADVEYSGYKVKISCRAYLLS